MSCEECERAQNRGDAYPFRWKHANIIVSGCKEHVLEVFDVLREAQKQ